MNGDDGTGHALLGVNSDGSITLLVVTDEYFREHIVPHEGKATTALPVIPGLRTSLNMSRAGFDAWLAGINEWAKTL